MKFAAITPTRGDRPELLQFCIKQLGRMTLKPDHHFIIDYKPETEKYDLVDRIKLGIAQARHHGYDLCFVIEDDDFLPADYFERFAPHFNNFHFFGQDYSTYYNLRNRTYNTFKHPYRASLFTTGFKISALNNYTFPRPDKKGFDIDLWKYARHKKRCFVDTGAIGIKHNTGLCMGVGHTLNMPNHDPELKWLESRTDSEAFEFYKDLIYKFV